MLRSVTQFFLKCGVAVFFVSAQISVIYWFYEATITRNYKEMLLMFSVSWCVTASTKYLWNLIKMDDEKERTP